MGLYDYMLLVSKDQYQQQQHSSATTCPSNSSGAVADGGIGGDVRESQVNNIEVSHGGTVVVKPTRPNGSDVSQDEPSTSSTSNVGLTAEEAKGGEKPKKTRPRSPTPYPSREEVEAGAALAEGRRSRPRLKNKNEKGKTEEGEEEERTGQFLERGLDGEKDTFLAAQSLKLKAAGKVGTALRRPVSLRRDALMRGGRPRNPVGHLPNPSTRRGPPHRSLIYTDKLTEQELMRKLVQDRVDQLNGRGNAKTPSKRKALISTSSSTSSNRPPPRTVRRLIEKQHRVHVPGEVWDGLEEERRLIHELRESAKRELKENAARKYRGTEGAVGLRNGHGKKKARARLIHRDVDRESPMTTLAGARRKRNGLDVEVALTPNKRVRGELSDEDVDMTDASSFPPRNSGRKKPPTRKKPSSSRRENKKTDATFDQLVQETAAAAAAASGLTPEEADVEMRDLELKPRKATRKLVAKRATHPPIGGIKSRERKRGVRFLNSDEEEEEEDQPGTKWAKPTNAFAGKRKLQDAFYDYDPLWYEMNRFKRARRPVVSDDDD